jgi:hypothetical protein
VIHGTARLPLESRVYNAAVADSLVSGGFTMEGDVETDRRSRRRLLLLRVLVNVAAWIVGLLALAVIGVPIALLVRAGIGMFSILGILVDACIIFLAAGWTVTVLVYLPVEIEFTNKRRGVR